ncbi:hypothetical protein C1141_15865, partial [Vibrio agarivorans]
LLTMPTIVMSTLVDDFERDLLGRWQAECFAVYNTFNNDLVNFNTTTVTVSPTLDVTTEVKVYAANDDTCQGSHQDVTLLKRFEVVGREYAQNSFFVYTVNVHTQNIDGEGARWEFSPIIYTSLFVDSERLYYAKPTTGHLGNNDESRHFYLDMAVPFEKISTK